MTHACVPPSSKKSIDSHIAAARYTWLLAACAALAGCGGGGSAAEPESPVAPPAPAPSPAPAPTPAAIRVEGLVAIEKAISQASVCVDLNANGVCDTGEPASSTTGEDGRYTIHYQPADEAAATEFNAAPLVAMLSTQSEDASAPGVAVAGKALTLRAPEGKTAQINPLTTLVHSAMQDGLTLAEAETAVSRQLATDVASLYDYQAEAQLPGTGLPGEVRAAARVTALMWELGVSPVFADKAYMSAASRQMGSLSYTDADNYEYRMRSSDGVLQADGLVHQFETRHAKSAGRSLAGDELYRSVTLTSKGWTRCDNTVARRLTLGMPGRTFVCNDSTRFVGFTKSSHDISDIPMAQVVANIQKGDEILIAKGLRNEVSMQLNPAALGDARFPAGSVMRVGVTLQNESSPIYINNVTADRFGFPSIVQMIRNRPAASVDLGAAGRSTVGGLGLVDSQHVLRAAFVDETTVQFYACESTAPAYNDLGACQPHSRSSFTVQTHSGVPVLTFATFPGSIAQNGMARGYTEFDGVVYPYRRAAEISTARAALTHTLRVNDVAWEAMKTVLKVE